VEDRLTDCYIKDKERAYGADPVVARYVRRRVGAFSISIDHSKRNCYGITMNPKLIVEQKITAFANKYAVYSTDPSGEKTELIAFAQQKRIAFKEKVTFFSDEAKTQAIFTLRAEKVIDVHGRYLVEDVSGNYIGSFKKEFKQSLLKSTWSILDESGQPTLQIAENSMTLALFRRFGSLIPIVGGLVDIVVLFLRYHFSITCTASGEEVGQYKKTTLLRDHYALSMTDEEYGHHDWRVLAAAAVALDALQSR
jgi:uncharacterized protein YxjI